MEVDITKAPGGPGVYIMKDATGVVLYVGKAKDLRKRMASYLRPAREGRYHICYLMEHVANVEYIRTATEKEALLLEYQLIQGHQPKYNIELKDGKTFVSVRLGMGHPFPGIHVTRRVKKDGAEYFGPYPSASASRETVNQLIRWFGLRICSDREFSNRSRPCVEYQIGRCTAPCVGLVSKEGYVSRVEKARLFLKGKRRELIKGLRKKMRQASYEMQFEEAGRLRDLIADIKRTLEKPVGAALRGRPPSPDREPTEGLPYVQIAGRLQKKLRLRQTPHIIECVDISNINGKYASGSLVTFVDGRSDKTRYRLFNIKGDSPPNDYVMMYETLERRFKHTEWPFPDLLLVDGGRGQLAVALRVLKSLGIVNLPVVAIAKIRYDPHPNLPLERGRCGGGPAPVRIYLPNRVNPVPFKRNDPAILYLIRIRDEAHRFAISHYRRRHRGRAISK